MRNNSSLFRTIAAKALTWKIKAKNNIHKFFYLFLFSKIYTLEVSVHLSRAITDYTTRVTRAFLCQWVRRSPAYCIYRRRAALFFFSPLNFCFTSCETYALFPLLLVHTHIYIYGIHTHQVVFAESLRVARYSLPNRLYMLIYILKFP